MPNNNRLLKRQKPTVEAWMQQYKGKLVRIVDRTCNYRDAIIEWSDFVAQPDGTTLVAVYQTTLELTPTGKIRKEQSQLSNQYFIQGSIEDLFALPGIKFESIAPPTKIRQSLYPKDENYVPKKRIRHHQFTLPIDPTAQRLQQVSLAGGDRTIYSVEELMSGTEEFLSLNFGLIRLPSPFIVLLKSFNCSFEEWEAIAQLSLVLNPRQLLPIIENIPQMRSIKEFTKFQQPVKVELQARQTMSQSTSIFEVN